MYYNYQDVVCLRGRGDVAIASVRTVKRGRRAGMREYTLASLSPGGFGGKTYAVVVVGEGNFSEALKKYTPEQIKAAIARVHGTRQEIQEAREARAEVGRQALGEQSWVRGKGVVGSKIAPGDEVLFEYRGGVRRWETVAKVNFATGKIAIVQRGYKKGYRWLKAHGVKESRSPRKALPSFVTISDRALEALAADGIYQFKFGREFIERSLVVAYSREAAQDARYDYDVGLTVVYFDETLGLYWRETGSFD